MNSFKSMPDWLWKLQARFGSTTASFFNFLRFMILLNFVNSIFILGLIMVPQLVPHDTNNTVDATDVDYYYYNNSNNTSPFYELNENHSELCSNYYYVDIYSVKQNQIDEDPTLWSQIQNNLLLFLQGKVFTTVYGLSFRKSQIDKAKHFFRSSIFLPEH